MRHIPSPFRRLLLALPLTLAPLMAKAADAPSVVVSIKPIHGLASAIMKGVGEPTLLLDGADSPHSYSLRPSEARALQNADLVIYVGHNLETFLEKPLSTLSKNSHQLELTELPGLSLLNMRAGGAWETHGHDDHDDHDAHAEDIDRPDIHAHDRDMGHDHQSRPDAHGDDDHHAEEHAHEQGDTDPHVWLHPANGDAIAKAIAQELNEIDPDHAANYRANLEMLLADLTMLRNELDELVAPVRGKPYVVFHDAYQYLEAGFDLNAVGSITVSPEQKPGVKRLHDVEDKIRDTGAVCIFAEPQFRPAIVRAIIADTGVRIGTLDPLGALIDTGPDAYQQILRQNVQSLTDCLGASE